MPPTHEQLWKRRASAVFALICAGLPATVLAHDAGKGPNGGVEVVTADVKHLELVSKQGQIIVYIANAKHEPISTSGGSGRAIVQKDGKTVMIDLVPAEPNLLTGKSETPLVKGTRVVVSATLAGGVAIQSRFVMP